MTEARRHETRQAPAAIVFDLDGVLLDSEAAWDETRRRFVAEHGGRWRPDATAAMMGMSSPEWSAYLHDTLGVAMPPAQIADAVAERLVRSYEEHLPLLPHAVETVERLAAHWPLGLASSANRSVIERVLDLTGLRGAFVVTVSSEEVARGKPAPDVYLAATTALRADPSRTVAIEDSANGIRSASAAGLVVVVIPNPHYPPSADALAAAARALGSLDELTPALVRGLVTD